MAERLNLNLLLPTGISRRQVMRALGAVGLGAAGLNISASGNCAFAQDQVLNYFTWSSWGEGPFIEAAKNSLNFDLKPTFYSSSDEMMAKLRGGGTKIYDMIVPVQNYVALAAKAGVIEPLNPAKMANAKTLFPEFQARPEWSVNGELYGVPFVWGANAIAYNRGVTGDIDSMDALFDPKWKGRITLRDEPEDSLGLAALKLGIKKPYEMDERELQEVKKLLISQKPLLRAYWKNIADVQNMLASGEVVVAWTMLAVITPLRKAGIDAGWVWPKEGAIGWSEAVSAVKGTRKLSLVEDYANFSLSPEYGEMMARYLGYAPCSEAAVDRLEPELVQELGIDTKAVSRLTFKGVPKDRSRWNEIWNEVKAA